MSTYRDFTPTHDYRNAAVSPDGTSVAVVDRVGTNCNIHLVDATSGESRQLTTFTEQAASGLAWHPDGTRLYFTADSGGNEEFYLHVVDIASGDVEAITSRDYRRVFLSAGGVSPDGNHLVFAAPVPDPEMVSVHIMDLATRDIRTLDNADQAAGDVSWSADGSRILGVSVRSNSDQTPYVWDVQSGRATEYTGVGRGELSVPFGFDAAGELIAASTRDRESLAVFRAATPDAQPELVVERDWEIAQAVVTRDTARLVFVENANGLARAEILDLSTGTTTPVEGLPAGEVLSMGASADGTTVAVLLQAPTSPANVYLVDTATGAARRVSDSKPVGDVELVNCTEAWVTSTEDTRVGMLVYRPAGEGPFPVVVSIHGGPEWQERGRYRPLYQALLARGIGVIAPNVRGSTGYGKTHQRKILRDWGRGDLEDFATVRDDAASLDWVDGNRIGVFGGSYGGFAVLSCLARQPELWACGVDVVGPSNLVTLTESVPAEWRPMIRGWVGDPVDDADMLRERSPLTYADQIVSPLFVIQGANDPRVAKAESDQIVDSLRARGVTVRYDVYDDEGHGFTKQANQIRADETSIEFFVENLKA